MVVARLVHYSKTWTESDYNTPNQVYPIQFKPNPAAFFNDARLVNCRQKIAAHFWICARLLLLMSRELLIVFFSLNIIDICTNLFVDGNNFIPVENLTVLPYKQYVPLRCLHACALRGLFVPRSRFDDVIIWQVPKSMRGRQMGLALPSYAHIPAQQQQQQHSVYESIYLACLKKAID